MMYTDFVLFTVSVVGGLTGWMCYAPAYSPLQPIKLKDSGMCSITISKGQLLVRKLANRPRTGLVPFLAPEIFRGERPTKACDVYSFGLLMWELYTGMYMVGWG